MSKVREDHKKALMDSGKWPDFVHYRDGLRAGGMKPSEATRQAVDKFLGTGAPGTGDAIPTTKPRDIEPPCPTVQPDNGLHDKADFAGKECSTAESLRWVARNLRALDVKVSDAPDAAAWNLLNAYRKSPMLECEFWKSMWMKTVEKGDLDGGKDDGKIDGSETLGLISRLMDLRDSVSRGGPVEGRRVHDPEITGSTPVSATNSGAGK